MVAHGTIDADNVTIPVWVKLVAASAIALGTYVGGWRIIRTVGKRVTGSVGPTQGFSAESSSAAVILASSYYGFPLQLSDAVGSGAGAALVGLMAAAAAAPCSVSPSATE